MEHTVHPASKVGLVLSASVLGWALVIYLAVGLVHTLGLS